jgi:hypothetical protein
MKIKMSYVKELSKITKHFVQYSEPSRDSIWDF